MAQFELNRRPVASLWIGTRLHYVNQLCLKSHLRQGHPVILYCTDALENAPEGVEIRPASEIMDISAKRVKETSASFWSNVFRYKMIRKTGAIWIDCDAFCHKPFPEDDEWIFSTHGMRGALNCGVVGLPAECELMDALLDYYDNLPDYPDWWNRKQREKMDTLSKDIPHATRIYMAERTAFGPQAFTHYVKVTGNMDKARPSSALYPVPFQLVDVFFDPHGSVEGWFQEDTLSVHLYTNAIKPYWIKNPPLLNSYVDRMCRTVGIDPVASLRGEPCDIEPVAEISTAVAAKTSTVDIQTQAVMEDLQDQLNKAGRVARRKANKAWTEGVVAGLCSQMSAKSTAVLVRPAEATIVNLVADTGAKTVVIETEEAEGGDAAERRPRPNYAIHQAGATEWRHIVEDQLAEEGSFAFLSLRLPGDALHEIEALDRAGVFDNVAFSMIETQIKGNPKQRKHMRKLREAYGAKYAGRVVFV